MPCTAHSVRSLHTTRTVLKKSVHVPEVPFTKTPGRWMTFEETHPKIQLFSKIKTYTEKEWQVQTYKRYGLFGLFGLFLIWYGDRLENAKEAKKLQALHAERLQALNAEVEAPGPNL